MKFVLAKKKLTLLIFFFPVLLFGQVELKNGAVIIDWGKHRKQTDSTQVPQEQERIPDDQDDAHKQKEREKNQTSTSTRPKLQNGYDPNWKSGGIFKLLVHAGINGCQIDGDGYSGYNYLGAEFGIGTLVRFHQNFSASMEINYTMKGARQAFVESDSPATLQKYQVQWDYIEVPFSINVQDKRFVMFSAGISIGVLVRDRERDEDGQPYLGEPPGGYPRPVDLSAHLGLYFIIHRNYILGGQFAYSLMKVRGPQYPGISRLAGEFNNDLTFRFMYLIDTVKKTKVQPKGFN